MRADEIAIETAKTSKVTAVVTVLSIFVKKDASCGALIAEMRSFLAKRQKGPIVPEEISHGLRNLSQKSRKGRIPKKLASKLKN
jgi:hypothetical protein